MSLNIDHLRMRSAQDIHEAFRLLGYPSYEPQAFEGASLDEFELDPSDRANVNRAYVVASLGSHTVYLYEVNSLNQVHLRSLAWHALQRGTALLIVTRDYREIRFVDPRLVGKFTKSNVRVNKLNLLATDPTRHDVDTLNSIHAHRRTAQQVYDAQAQAFNITSITKKFYEEYRRHYERARAVIRQYNKGIREFQNTDETDKLHAFTQRLLGRLMFLYFLQRKGWLGGKYKFLTEQYTAIQRAHDGETTADAETFYYYTEVLEPLFYDTLNTKRLDNLTRWQGLRIPYLNGGLFDRERDPQGIIILPDSLFDPNSPEGVLAFFNRYNFTIADDTPLEQDVAVDPEMLGKVFENMLEERDRGQSGSFYTPRTIVSYMCQEALVGYLEESANVPREITRAQFDPDNTARFEREQLPAITAALDTLTVLDPAVGSGSFLIGMMNEIIRLRKACHVVQAPSEAIKPETVAQWKASIIRDTLYGVDIKPEAIEIAQLRLWLALVVEQTLEQAHPLPNLDYKLMAGNSLIETIDGEPILTENARAMIGKHAKPEQLTLIGGATDNERFKLDELRQRFFTATPAERTHLRADIEAQERRIVATSLRERADIREKNIAQLARRSAQMKGILSKAEQNKMNVAVTALAHLTALQDEMNKPTYTPPFFIYRLKFSEVFERKGGFDIVVANPPYVRGEKIGAQKEELKASVLYQDVFAGSADLYVYFYKRAYEVLKPRGQLAFITTNKFIKARYGAGLKKFLVNNMTLHELIDFGDLPIFKEAIAYPNILIASKHPTPEQRPRFTQVTTFDEGDTVQRVLAERGQILPTRALKDAEWTLANHNMGNLLDKIKRDGVSLGEYVNGTIYRGVVTGYNEAFVIDRNTRDQLIARDPRSAEVIKPLLRGRDIKRWEVDFQDQYLIFSRRGININNYPAIRSHLEKYQHQLTPGVKGGRKKGSYQWYEIQDNTAYYLEFEKPKIVYQVLQVKPVFAFDKMGAFAYSAWIIPKDDFYLLAILNSPIGWYQIKQYCTEIQNGYQLIWNYFQKLTIPNTSEGLRGRIATLAQQCLDATAKGAPVAPLEAELNALVYEAYGLTADEIAIIESGTGSSSQPTHPSDEE